VRPAGEKAVVSAPEDEAKAVGEVTQ